MNEKLPAGRLLQVETGSYSDRYTIGFFVVLHEFSPHEEEILFKAGNPQKSGYYSFPSHEFVAYLIRKGYLMDVSFNLMEFGDYSEKESAVYLTGPGIAD